MISNEHITSIQKLLNNKKIINTKILSCSFGINCVKITTLDKKNYIVKYYINTDIIFNSIKSETKNLIFLDELNLKLFPKIYTNDDKYLIISYLENDGVQPSGITDDLLSAITKIHLLEDVNYGFKFDTQIGGIKQKNVRENNWVDFYKNYRLGYIYDLINHSNPMDMSINKKIENLLKNLENFIPNNPKPSLLHGDLWEGNILFNNKKLVGFIDPGSFYGHNELEVAYLRWFNPSFIDNGFLEKYNNIIRLNEEYLNYEPIYQLYYSLLNVHLWDRKYINDVLKLLDKIKI